VLQQSRLVFDGPAKDGGAEAVAGGDREEERGKGAIALPGRI
jgi:hypothetical protein